MMRSFLPYAQLVRLPNVFTAMSDILLAAFAVGALPDGWPAFLLILLASSCLYCSGMAWNDIFDREQDARERPFRPIPSGNVSLSMAISLATVLMLIGVGLSAIVAWQQQNVAPLGVSIALCMAILLYDSWLKHTWAGPLAMGLCRFFNVLLGLTLAVGVWQEPWGLVLCTVVWVYITGVTWFARTEAKDSQKTQLILAFAVMILGVCLALALPELIPVDRDADTNQPVDYAIGWSYLLLPYFLFGFLLYIGHAIIPALNRPIPERVQPAVKRCVLGLVVLDAVLATVFVGPMGLLIALLLVPSMWLGKRLYST